MTMKRHQGRQLAVVWQHDLATLHALYRAERNGEIQPRWHALWLLRAGWREQAVAHLVGVDRTSVSRWVRRYRLGGLDEVRAHRVGNRQPKACRLTPAQQETVRQWSAHGEIAAGAQVQHRIETAFGVQYRRGGLSDLLARLKLHPKVPRPRAEEAPVDAQEAWKTGASATPSPV